MKTQKNKNRHRMKVLEITGKGEDTGFWHTHPYRKVCFGIDQSSDAFQMTVNRSSKQSSRSGLKPKTQFQETGMSCGEILSASSNNAQICISGDYHHSCIDVCFGVDQSLQRWKMPFYSDHVQRVPTFLCNSKENRSQHTTENSESPNRQTRPHICTCRDTHIVSGVDIGFGVDEGLET